MPFVVAFTAEITELDLIEHGLTSPPTQYRYLGDSLTGQNTQPPHIYIQNTQ